MTEEDIEVKVAKLETKVDTIIETVAQINNKFDSLSEDRVTRRELEEDFSRRLLTILINAENHASSIFRQHFVLAMQTLRFLSRSWLRAVAEILKIHPIVLLAPQPSNGSSQNLTAQQMLSRPSRKIILLPKIVGFVS